MVSLGSSKSADVLSLKNNDCKDIMAAEEVIEIILEQIIDNVIDPDQVQAVLQFQDQDYFYVQDKDDQVRKLNSGCANHLSGMYPQGRPVRPRSHLNFQIP